MKKLTLVLRILFGLVFLLSGISFFFISPPPMEGPAGDFFKGMAATQYFFYLLKGCEIFCGILLIIGRFVPLALVILAPIVLNILFVHIFLMTDGLPVAIVLVVVQIYLSFIATEYSPSIKMLFKAK